MPPRLSSISNDLPRSSALPSLNEIMRGTYAAWRIALRDPQAVTWLDDTIPGVWKSFSAAVLVAPYYALATWQQLADPSSVHAPLPIIIMVESICYVLGWLIFPLLVHHFCVLTQRENLFPRFLAALNWSALVQMIVLLPLVLLDTAQIMTPDWQSAIYLAIGLLLYIYLGMIIRDTLELTAAGIVGLVICCILVDAALLAVAQNILGIQS